MATIAISGLPEITELDDSDILHISSDGVDKMITVENLTSSIDIEASLPIGYIYTQYPGKDTPSELGLPGIWENISSEFAGDFFRAEGGNASTFEAGEQACSNLEHYHGLVSNTTTQQYNDTASFDQNNALNGLGSGAGNTAYDVGFYDEDYQGNQLVESVGDSEAKPINHTIRIWERTA